MCCPWNWSLLGSSLKEAIPGALVATNALKISYKWREPPSHSKDMVHEMVKAHPENSSEPTPAFPEGTSGEPAEHVLGKRPGLGPATELVWEGWDRGIPAQPLLSLAAADLLQHQISQQSQLLPLHA